MNLRPVPVPVPISSALTPLLSALSPPRPDATTRAPAGRAVLPEDLTCEGLGDDVRYIVLPWHLNRVDHTARLPVPNHRVPGREPSAGLDEPFAVGSVQEDL